jgi:hypothetical protein
MPTLEIIEWQDHVSGSTNQWVPLDNLRRDARLEDIQSVGWVTYENKEMVVIVPHLCERDKTGCGEMVILKSAILKRKKL